ncbi:MAG: hypothetical protein HS115_01465 [Spirochaetales bacterium]|nr:hypothetical protein [Spirochaetales bacterium]
MLRVLVSGSLFFLLMAVLDAAPAAAEQARIDFLLAEVARSRATFVRNGVDNGSANLALPKIKGI